METQKVYTQHEENKKWMNDLLFFQDEMKVMKNRLAEIASKNTSKDILAKLEHFQNQIIVQQNNVDNLKHVINVDNDGLRAEIKKNTTAVDRRSVKDHTALRNEMESFSKVYTDNKNEFNRFLSQYM